MSIVPIDLLGNGTACLVWSSPLPGDARRPMRYVDLMGGHKPHLLVKTINNLGAETRVDYAPSTKFYLQDKRDGKPWITRLPFPVHVVERVETYDHISRNRFVTRYAYHHGYFDGEEREFRGFGMVEQWDTEAVRALTGRRRMPAGDNIDAASHVPPVHTKTWFHTGVYLGRDHVSDFFAGLLNATDQGEYFREPGLTDAEARALLLPDTVLPAGLTLEEEREACRALKGSMLRQEVYADDAGPAPRRTDRARPHALHRHRAELHHPRLAAPGRQPPRRLLHPRARGDQLSLRAQPGRSAHPARADAGGRRLRQRAQASRHRLRAPHADPRRRRAGERAAGAQPRPRRAAASRSSQADHALLTYTENRVTNAIESRRHAPHPAALRGAHLRADRLHGHRAGRPLPGRRTWSSPIPPLPAACATSSPTEVAYEATATGNPCRRPIEWLRTLYRRDDLTQPAAAR